MPTTCVFQLDRTNPIYSSGEYINGRILLRTDKVKRVNAVYVTLEGEAKVQWSMNGKSETANYYGHQQYLYTRTNVFDCNEFPSGTHVYILTLRIPPDCPSTCSGPYGYIAYNISLTVDKPWSFNEVFRKPITVSQTLDLNYNPEYLLPVRDENIKYLCRWPCTSGPILYNLTVPYAGFVAGQRIPFVLEVDNQSPHYDVSGIEASLKQHFIFLARKPIKRNYFTKTLKKTILTDSTLRLTKRLYEATIQVPQDTPRSTLNSNYIVFLHYTLQLKLKTGPMHFDTKLRAPIVIGTVPLRVRQGCNALVTTVQPMAAATPSSAMATVASSTNASGFASTATSIDETDVDADADEETSNDEPPSYDDSCLPPSFSFATLGSQQTIDSDYPHQTATVERQRINLPQFPSYNTFASRPQAIQFLSGIDLSHNEDSDNDADAVIAADNAEHALNIAAAVERCSLNSLSRAQAELIVQENNL